MLGDRFAARREKNFVEADHLRHQRIDHLPDTREGSRPAGIVEAVRSAVWREAVREKELDLLRSAELASDAANLVDSRADAHGRRNHNILWRNRNRWCIIADSGGHSPGSAASPIGLLAASDQARRRPVRNGTRELAAPRAPDQVVA